MPVLPRIASRLSKQTIFDLLIIALAVVGSRVALELIGLTAHLLMGAYRGYNVVTGSVSLDMWGVWDGAWYLDIARNGYASAAKPNGEANWAFFPLFPIIIRLITPLVGEGTRAGIIVANVAFCAASVMMYLMVRRRHGRDLAIHAVIGLCVFPGSLVYSAIYTESLFLLLVICAIYFLDRRMWWSAAVVIGLAGATRSLGVLLAAPLIALWLAHHRGKSAEFGNLVKLALLLIIVGSGLATFAGHLWLRAGDPLAFMHVQAAWGRHFGNPLTFLWEPFDRLLTVGLADIRGPGETPLFAVRAWLNAIGTISAIVLLVGFRRFMSGADWLLAICLLVIPMFAGLLSMVRFILVIPFIYPAVGRWLSARWVGPLLASFLGLVNGLFMASFATGRIIW